MRGKKHNPLGTSRSASPRPLPGTNRLPVSRKGTGGSLMTGFNSHFNLQELDNKLTLELTHPAGEKYVLPLAVEKAEEFLTLITNSQAQGKLEQPETDQSLELYRSTSGTLAMRLYSPLGKDIQGFMPVTISLSLDDEEKIKTTINNYLFNNSNS